MLPADASCRLLEVDFSGIEMILTGWFIPDPKAIRLGRLGMHAALTALRAHQPVDLTWPDEQIREYLRPFKKHPLYDSSKRCIHGTDYALTPFGMVEQFPTEFPTIKAAQEVQEYYFHLVPGLPIWHRTLREQAKKNGYLGGAPPAHPFGYRHWFWDVYGYQPTDEVTARRWVRDPARKDRIVMLHGRPFKVVWGNDAKRCIAFLPQSTAAGVLKRAELRLFLPESPDYIGDAYFGKTPLRAPIHDSLLMEVPNRAWDRVLETVVRVMQDPIPELPLPVEWNMGTHLRIGVAAKGGKNWAPKTDSNLGGMADLPTPGLEAGDITPGVESAPGLPWDEQDWEEWRMLERVVLTDGAAAMAPIVDVQPIPVEGTYGAIVRSVKPMKWR